MENRRNYYRILQIQPDAPFEVVRASYFTLLRELKQHPDLGGNHWNSTILNEAYSVLSDSRKRAEYDKKLFSTYTKKPFPGESSSKPSVASVFCPSCKQPVARNSNSTGNCIRCNDLFKPEKEKKPNVQNRRSVFRMKNDGDLYYSTTSPKTKHGAQLVDISTEGLRFLCEQPLNPNMTIKISSATLSAIANVVNVQQCEQKGKKLYSVGISFKEVAFNNQEGSFFSVSA